MPLYAGARDTLEKGFVDGALVRRHDAPRVHFEYAEACFAEASRAEQVWLKRVESAPRRASLGWLYQRAWSGFNREARMPAR